MVTKFGLLRLVVHCCCMASGLRGVFLWFLLRNVRGVSGAWLRPLALDYRSKIEEPKWRKAWDYALCFSGTSTANHFGVAFGNLLQGVPFELNEFMMSKYHGTFFALLNPFALLWCVGSDVVRDARCNMASNEDNRRIATAARVTLLRSLVSLLLLCLLLVASGFNLSKAM